MFFLNITLNRFSVEMDHCPDLLSAINNECLNCVEYHIQTKNLNLNLTLILNYIINCRNPQILDFIIKEFSQEINLLDDSNMSPLMRAVINHNIPLILSLIKNNVDINLYIEEYNFLGVNLPKRSALSVALDQRDLIVMKLLLEKGADPSPFLSQIKDNLITILCCYRNSLLIDFFLDKFPVRNDSLKRSPLQIAVINNNEVLISRLLIKIKDSKDLENTLNYRIPFLESSLNYTYAGYTALHFAVEKNNPEIVKILLDFGADPTLTNILGQTPLQLSKNLDIDALFYSL